MMLMGKQLRPKKAQKLGLIDDVLKTMESLEKRYGKRFKAASLLREKAKAGAVFHDPK